MKKASSESKVQPPLFVSAPLPPDTDAVAAGFDAYLTMLNAPVKSLIQSHPKVVYMSTHHLY